MQAKGPLAGVRIVEIDAIGPVPFAAMLLADLGADVVRIVQPDASASHVVPGLYRGRRELVLDFRHPAFAFAGWIPGGRNDALDRAKRLGSLVRIAWKQLGNCGYSTLFVDPQEQVLLPQRLFQLIHGSRPARRLRVVQLLENREATLVDASLACANIGERAERCFYRPALLEPCFQVLALPRLYLLAQGIALGPAPICFFLGVQADQRLQPGRTIGHVEQLFGHRVPRRSECRQ